MFSMKNGIAFLTIVAATACAAGEAQWTGSITDSAGVQIVSNTAEGIWTEETRWTVVEELRIGSLDEEPEYQFGQVGGIDVASDGRMFVLDIQGQHVKVYSAEGQYEQTIGGPGSGPGEIGPPGGGGSAVVMAGGDTLLVPDLANQRVNRYGPDGTVLSSFPMDFQSQGFPIAWQTTPSGLVAMQVRPLITGEEGETPQDYIFLIAPDGSITDTITSFASGETFSFSGGIPEWHIYSPETAWRLTDEGQLLRGISDAYRLSEYTRSDSLTRVVTMPFELRPVTEGDKDLILRLFRELFEDQGVPPTFIGRLLERVSFGETLPAFVQIQMGPQGSIWVQHVRAVSDLPDDQIDASNFLEEFGSPSWDVLDREGRYLGVVTMPDRFAPRVIVENKIYGVWRDDLDVQYIVRLRIEGVGVLAE